MKRPAFVENLLSERPVPRSFGLMACATVIGWAAFVGGRHGFINEDAPKNTADLERDIDEFILDHQNTAEILEFAKTQPQGRWESDMLRHQDESFFREVEERIDQHRRLARREIQPAEGEVFDLAAFLGSEAQRLGDHARVGLPHVSTKTVLFQPNEMYELLCSTETGAEAAFDEYIDKLVAARWSVETVQFHPGDRRGYFVAYFGGATELLVAVMEKEVFPGAPTTIYWHLEGPVYKAE